MKRNILLMMAVTLLTAAFFCGCSPKDNVDNNSESTVTSELTGKTPQTTETRIESQTTVSETEAPGALQRLLDAVAMESDAGQILLSFQDDAAEERKGRVYAYELIDGRFASVMPGMDAVFGRNGLDKEKEGDGKAPSGVFKILFAFGAAEPDPGLLLEYRKTTENDYWVDDQDSPDYNTWQTYDGDPRDKWGSYERLNIPAYRLAFVIGYNRFRIKGLGSAIFFHVWKDKDTYTAGCTASSEENVAKILSWLDADKNPVIAQGSIKFFIETYGIDPSEAVRDDDF